MFTIDDDLCIRCGNCVKCCPMGVFARGEDGAVTAQQRACLDCFHCAAACPTGAILHHELGADICRPVPAAEGTLLPLLQRRRSIRRYKPITPDKTLIQRALEGAGYAPSAKNQRCCRWSVVLGSEKVEEVCALALDWARGERDYRHLVWLHRHGVNPVTCGAPCLIAVHCPEDSHNPQTDAAIAATLAEQLLVEGGLGTCWGGYLCRMINQCGALQTALSIPEGHQVYGVLMVGEPDEHYSKIPYRPGAKITWVE